MKFKLMNLHLTSVVILLGSCLASVPTPNDAPAQEITAQELKAQQRTASDTLTIEEVKAAGARRSIYRTPTPQSKTLETPQANLKAFRAEIEPTLTKACYHCHGSKTAEGEFRVDTLDPDLLHGEDAKSWLEVSAAVNNGEMPPEEAPQLTDDERIRLITWLSSEIQNASRRLALSTSAIDELMSDAGSLRRDLSTQDQQSFDEFLDSVRETEVRVAKAARWMDVPLRTVEVDHLNLDISPNDPREYIQTMYELIYLVFKTDSTRVATYMLGKELGAGISDYLARAVGLPLTHKLSHETKLPDGWKNFGTYCRFQAEEFSRFAARLKSTPESTSEGNMLDNSLLLFGSASSAFHLSRNYPLILVVGNSMGFKHGQYLNFAGDAAYRGGWAPGDTEPQRLKATYEDLPLSNLYVTMLQKLGVQTESFGGSSKTLSEV